ncbi:hypothetical protein [Amaricoccus solimangrovi]|uniref:hypothetical protein n=1 Tax=Amaricoccus solimangrovi TaxID=2589815 RepID=UPI0015E34FF9|nr:hypothetical protein [Amaricoccus solimangrovi]
MRFLLTLVIAVLIVALVTRAGSVWRLLMILLGLAALYTVLKLTGLVDSFDPRGMGFL